MRRPKSPIALARPSLKQSQGYNLSYVALMLISSQKDKKKNKQEKTTATAAKIRESNVYSAFEQPGHWSYICIPRTADCSSGPHNGGCLHENLFLILAPFEANSGGPVQQSVMLLELTNTVFQS